MQKSFFQTQCGEQEEEIRRLSGRVEQLNEARSEQARQLAEARLRVQTAASKERQDRGEREQQMQEQLSQAREIEQQVCVCH